MLQELSSALLQELSCALLQELSSALLQELISALLQELSSALLQDLSSALLQELSSALLQELSCALLQELRGVHGACEALQQTVAQLKQRLVMEASKQMDLTGLPLPNTPWLCLSASFQAPALPFSFACCLCLCVHIPSHQPLLLMTLVFCVSKISREAFQIPF